MSSLWTIGQPPHPLRQDGEVAGWWAAGWEPGPSSLFLVDCCLKVRSWVSSIPLAGLQTLGKRLVLALRTCPLMVP